MPVDVRIGPSALRAEKSFAVLPSRHKKCPERESEGMSREIFCNVRALKRNSILRAFYVAIMRGRRGRQNIQFATKQKLLPSPSTVLGCGAEIVPRAVVWRAR